MLAKTPLKDLMIEWLQTKNPKTKYYWGDPTRCACAQFARHVKRYNEWLNGAEEFREWKDLDLAALDCDWTFGDLLRRLQ